MTDESRYQQGFICQRYDHYWQPVDTEGKFRRITWKQGEYCSGCLPTVPQGAVSILYERYQKGETVMNQRKPVPRRASMPVQARRTTQEHTPILQTGRQSHPSSVEPDEMEDIEDAQEAGSLITHAILRYDGIPMPDGMFFPGKKRHYYVHDGPPPAQYSTENTSRRTTADPRLVRPRRHLHWLFFMGIGLLIMLAGYLSLNSFAAWWQTHTDDGTYGRPRTSQTDAVVGHDDSAVHPSHFIAINLNRHISIIEFPGGRADKAVIYSGPVLLGDGQDFTPVTLTFSDVNGDGKVDMTLHILDQGLVYLNNGTRFVPPSSLAVEGNGTSSSWEWKQ